jgi:predicted transcriptional regulator of viral defense system
MEFRTLLTLVGNEPLFETGLLLAGKVDVRDVRRQLSRWVASGQVQQFRRGVYTLAPPFRKRDPHVFVVANRLVRGSYVSCQAALAFHGLIPEAVPVTTSVTMRRPGRWQTPVGAFEYRHIAKALFAGYALTDLGGGQQAYVATPEKALLDLIHLQPGGDAPEYVRELRLQNLDRLDVAQLAKMADSIGSPKLRRAVEEVVKLVTAEAREYSTL